MRRYSIGVGASIQCFAEENAVRAYWLTVDPSNSLSFEQLLSIHADYLASLAFVAMLFIALLQAMLLNFALLANVINVCVALFLSLCVIAASIRTQGFRTPAAISLLLISAAVAIGGFYTAEKRLRDFFILEKARAKGLKAVLLAKMVSSL